MTLEEIRAAKQALERQILVACEAFTRDTGLAVTELRLEHVEHRPFEDRTSWRTLLSNIRAKVDLGL